MNRALSRSILGASLLAIGVAISLPASSQTGATGTAARAAPTNTLTSSDQEFATNAVKGGVAEIKLGQLAVAKAQAPEVKQFGQRMIDDHSAANDKLTKLAAQKGMQPAQETDAAAQREYVKLDKLPGARFDQEYMSQMVSDHQKDIKEFQQAAQTAKDPDIKSFAHSTLPILLDHLLNAKTAQAAAKNEKKTAAKS
jgi:putative membrane protein